MKQQPATALRRSRLVRYERLEIETETLASAQEGKLGVTWRRSPQRE